MSAKPSRWLWAGRCAVVMTLLAIYPVLDLRLRRGNDENGSFAHLQPDELSYAAYVTKN